jgi:hypothetical protein
VQVGFVSGVGEAVKQQPRRNYTKDPYWTDGQRLVLFVTDEKVPLEKTKVLDWE